MLTVQIVLISIVYLGTYISIWGIGSLLSTLGTIGETIASLVKGFNYLFGILLALLLKAIIHFISLRGHRSKPLLDSYLMNNISSLFFNIMITASVMAISVEAIKNYWEMLLQFNNRRNCFLHIYRMVWKENIFK